MKKLLLIVFVILILINLIGYAESYSVKFYQVKKGDAAWNIVRKYHITMTVLMDWNKLKAPKIYPGQILIIPQPNGILHKIVYNEDIYSLSKYYRTPAYVIAFYNNGFIDYKNGDTVFIPLLENYEIKRSGFIWPLYGRITSPYGWRIHPITHRREFHTGIDIGAPLGSPIFAALSGTVVFAGRNGGYGNEIMIKHAKGYATVYGHLSQIDVYVGEYVEKGDFIGRVGSTGFSTGPHLHFEIRRYGKTYDPLIFLPKKDYLNAYAVLKNEDTGGMGGPK
jgi:LysM repeat protein